MIVLASYWRGRKDFVKTGPMRRINDAFIRDGRLFRKFLRGCSYTSPIAFRDNGKFLGRQALVVSVDKIF